MAKSCLNIGENLFRCGTHLCLFPKERTAAEEKEPGNNLNLQTRKHSWSGSNFLNWARIGEVIRYKTYTLDPNAQLSGQISSKNSVEAYCELTSVKFFTSNRWKPWEGERTIKMHVGMLMVLYPRNSQILLC